MVNRRKIRKIELVDHLQSPGAGISRWGYCAKLTKSNKTGARGVQVTVYSVANADCPHRQTIYTALDRGYSKLLADVDPVSTRCINNDVIQHMDTDSDSHPEVKCKYSNKNPRA